MQHSYSEFWYNVFPKKQNAVSYEEKTILENKLNRYYWVEVLCAHKPVMLERANNSNSSPLQKLRKLSNKSIFLFKIKFLLLKAFYLSLLGDLEQFYS